MPCNGWWSAAEVAHACNEVSPTVIVTDERWGWPAVPATFVGIEAAILPYLVASDAKLVEGKVVGDPTEGALLVLGAKAGLDTEATRDQYPRLATLPFDPTYKLMATFNAATDPSGYLGCIFALSNFDFTAELPSLRVAATVSRCSRSISSSR